jgi:hypothetical protein
MNVKIPREKVCEVCIFASVNLIDEADSLASPEHCPRMVGPGIHLCKVQRPQGRQKEVATTYIRKGG